MEEHQLQPETLTRAIAVFPEEFARIALTNRELDSILAPGNDGGWGIIEILCHLTDWEEIYLERAQRIVNEDKPYLPGYDDELWPIERNYRGQDPAEVLARFQQLRQTHLNLLQTLEPEDWERTGEHGYFGEVSLAWLTNHVVEHDGEHLAQARDVLA